MSEPTGVYIVVCDGDAFGPFDTSAGALAWLGFYTLLYKPKQGGVCQYTSPPPSLTMPEGQGP